MVGGLGAARVNSFCAQTTAAPSFEAIYRVSRFLVQMARNPVNATIHKSCNAACAERQASDDAVEPALRLGQLGGNNVLNVIGDHSRIGSRCCWCERTARERIAAQTELPTQ